MQPPADASHTEFSSLSAGLRVSQIWEITRFGIFFWCFVWNSRSSFSRKSETAQRALMAPSHQEKEAGKLLFNKSMPLWLPSRPQKTLWASLPAFHFVSCRTLSIIFMSAYILHSPPFFLASALRLTEHSPLIGLGPYFSRNTWHLLEPFVLLMTNQHWDNS